MRNRVVRVQVAAKDLAHPMCLGWDIERRGKPRGQAQSLSIRCGRRVQMTSPKALRLVKVEAGEMDGSELRVIFLGM